MATPNGLKSVERTVKTREFYRLRLGVSPSSASGKLKKPSGENAVMKFLLGKFKPSEESDLKKVFKRAGEAMQAVIDDGAVIAMNKFN